MAVRAIIGVDPGQKGGVAVISGNELVSNDITPRIKHKNKWEYDVRAMNELLVKVKHLNPVMYLEKVHSMPKQGVRSTFNFGTGYGIWIGLATANNIPLELVTPQKWKGKILADTDKSKGAAITKAIRVFPHVDLKPGRLITHHDGMADAICIALFGGTQQWL